MNSHVHNTSPGYDSRLRKSFKLLVQPWKRLFSTEPCQLDIFERDHACTAISTKTPSHLNSEDYTTPTLDLTTEIVTDSSIKYASVRVISCERERRGSVVTNSLFRSLSCGTCTHSMGASMSDECKYSIDCAEEECTSLTPENDHSLHSNDISPSLLIKSVLETLDLSENVINCYSFVDMVNSDSRYIYNAPEYVKT